MKIEINYYYQDTVELLEDTLLTIELHEETEDKQRLISLLKHLIIAFEKGEDYCPTLNTLEDYFRLINDIDYIVDGNYELCNSGQVITLYGCDC